MRKIILLLLLLVLPFVGWAQNDSVELKKKTPVILKCTSCNGLPKPLMVMDGNIVDYDKTINEINPDEIESITVLKNENAIEKYGEKGKNGVIEIHLKENSYNQNMLPQNALYVIDGSYVEKNEFEILNPTEIFSIEILKNTTISHISKDVVIIKTKKYQVELDSKKEQYDLAVSDLGYESFLAMQPSAETYSLSYLQNKNKQYVSIWNSRVNTGNPDIYEMQIDYDSQTYYGLEFEYKLFQFFKFMENKYKISFI